MHDPQRSAPSAPGAPVTSSRRAVIASGLGAAVGFLASALGRPAPTDATNGDPMTLGSSTNTAANTTKVTIATDDMSTFWAVGTGARDIGVRGTGGNFGTGVYGEASGAGGKGLHGYADGTGVYGESNADDGVSGVTFASTGAGVSGFAPNAGKGLWGSSTGGVGVLGDSDTSIGVSGTSDSWIGVSGSSASLYGVYGEANGSGSAAVGVHGTSTNGIGILAKSKSPDQPGGIGWSGNNSTGLQGISNGYEANPPTPRAKTGVMGQATQDSASLGVLGISTTGTGVRGEATSGAALRGTASGKAGYAVRGSGRVRFEKVSGVATIAANATSVKITPGTDVTTGSFVLLTAQSNIGSRSLYYTVDAAGDTITIHISSSRTSSTVVAWLLLN